MEYVINNNRATTTMQSERSAAWLITFAAALFFFYEFMLGTMFASIADNLMAEFNIGIDRLSSLSSVYYVSNVMFLFVAGMLLDRFSPRKIILAAMLLCVASTFGMAYIQSFGVAVFLRFLTGIGSAFCFLGPVRVASQWFPPQRMALITGIIVTMGMTGGMAAQYPFTQLVLHFGWRGALVVLGCIGIGMFVLMWFALRDNVNAEPPAKRENNPWLIFKRAYLNRQALLAASYTSLMNASVAVLGAMVGNMYLVERLGVDKSDASLVNSMLFFGVIVGGPLMGWWSDRIGQRIMPMRTGALLALAVVVAIIYAPASLGLMAVLFFLLGLFTSAGIIGYPLVGESSPPEMRVTCMSIVSLLTQGGYVVYQKLFGKILTMSAGTGAAEHSYALANYNTALLVLPAAIILALLAVSWLREPNAQRS